MILVKLNSKKKKIKNNSSGESEALVEGNF